jgi:hypothetical protein
VARYKAQQPQVREGASGQRRRIVSTGKPATDVWREINVNTPCGRQHALRGLRPVQ